MGAEPHVSTLRTKACYRSYYKGVQRITYPVQRLELLRDSLSRLRCIVVVLHRGSTARFYQKSMISSLLIWVPGYVLHAISLSLGTTYSSYGAPYCLRWVGETYGEVPTTSYSEYSAA